MADGVDPIDRGRHHRRVGHVAHHQVDLGRQVVGDDAAMGQEAVEHADGGPAGQELVDHMGADEPGAAGDQDVHPAMMPHPVKASAGGRRCNATPGNADCVVSGGGSISTADHPVACSAPNQQETTTHDRTKEARCRPQCNGGARRSRTCW